MCFINCLFSSQNHSYSLATSGLINNIYRTFVSREDANKYMYNVCKKEHLNIREVWDDNHDKTYCCNNNVKFYIQRCD